MLISRLNERAFIKRLLRYSKKYVLQSKDILKLNVAYI